MDKVLKLIFEYYEQDIFNCNLKEETILYIVGRFKAFVDAGLTVTDLTARGKKKKGYLKPMPMGKLKEIKVRLQKDNVQGSPNHKAYPIRLGLLKPELQQEAYTRNVSLQKHIQNILSERKKD